MTSTKPRRGAELVHELPDYHRRAFGMRDCKRDVDGPHQPVGVFILTTGAEVGWHSFRRVISLQGTKRGLLSHVDDKHPGTAIHNEKRGEGIKVPTLPFVIAQETWANSHVSKVKEDKLWKSS